MTTVLSIVVDGASYDEPEVYIVLDSPAVQRAIRSWRSSCEFYLDGSVEVEECEKLDEGVPVMSTDAFLVSAANCIGAEFRGDRRAAEVVEGRARLEAVMSTDFITRRRMSLDEAKKLLTEAGWREHKIEGSSHGMTDGNGGFVWLDEMGRRVSMSRYGANYAAADAAAEILDAVSEHDEDEYSALLDEEGGS